MNTTQMTHTANMSNMANIVELGSDELLSIKGGWDWGDLASGLAFGIGLGVAVASGPVLVALGFICGGVALFLND